MRFAVAFKEAMKYHAVASVPTFVGGAIAAVALWFGLVDPALTTVTETTGGPQQLLQALIATSYDLPILVGGVVAGLVVRRVGRTTLLFRIHGTTVVDTVEREVVPDDGFASDRSTEPQSVESDSVESEPAETGSVDASDDTDDFAASDDTDDFAASDDTDDFAAPDDDADGFTASDDDADGFTASDDDADGFTASDDDADGFTASDDADGFDAPDDDFEEFVDDDFDDGTAAESEPRPDR